MRILDVTLGSLADVLDLGPSPQHVVLRLFEFALSVLQSLAERFDGICVDLRARGGIR